MIIVHILLCYEGGVPLLIEEMRSKSMKIPTIYKRIKDCSDFPARGFVCEHIDDNQIFTLDEGDDSDDSMIRLQAIYTPGHTDDHVSFLFYEDEALISGED
jgi:glyoxylase-like metal-dependent hydrolase (beta-lactamase superfamily II)